MRTDLKHVVEVSMWALTMGVIASPSEITKIGDGTIDNAEFGTLDGVTAPLQTQLAGKLANESDPQVGALTDGKWCSSDGAVVSCGLTPVVPDSPAYASTAAAPADAVFVDDAGKVGIGTTVPLAPLDIPGPGRIGDGTNNPFAYVNGAAGTDRTFTYRSSGADRWSFKVNSTAEAGNNSGSDLEIVPHDDAGNATSTALAIRRSSGKVRIGAGASEQGNLNVFDTFGQYTITGGGAQPLDYRNYVILLHAAYDGSPLPLNYTLGTIHMRRGDATSFLRFELAEIAAQSADGLDLGSLRSRGTHGAVKSRLVTVRYNGVKYVALDTPYNNARMVGLSFVGFHQSTAPDTLKYIPYYETSTSTVLDAEIYGSIADLPSYLDERVDASLASFSGQVRVGQSSTSHSTLQVMGSVSTSVATTDVDRTLDASDSVLLVDGGSGDVEIALPSAAGIAGRRYVVKRIDGSPNQVDVIPSGAEMIDGAASYPLTAQYKYVALISDGADWMVTQGN